MSRWSLGVFQNDRGKLVTVYVRKDGTPVPYETYRVGGRPILYHNTYTNVTYSEARKLLLEEAADPTKVRTPAEPAPPILQHREPFEPSDKVNEWVRALHIKAKSTRLILPKAFSKTGKSRRLSDELILKLAALIALVGSKDDGWAENVAAALIQLFFHPARVKSWTKAIEMIPPTDEALIRIADHVTFYNQRAGIDRLRLEKFDLEKVLEVMLQVKDAKAYLEHCAQLPNARAVYHPNTFAVVKSRFRAKFGALAATTAEYEELHRSRGIRVVESD